MQTLNSEQLRYCAETIRAGIKDFVSSAGAKGAVVAVSGGVDSALVLKLASDVVDVYALLMPDLDTNNEKDTRDAEELCDLLEVPYSVVSITDVFSAVKESFPWVEFDDSRRDFAASNIKPRLRMVFNYLLANLDSRVVLGTGNKTELLLGYLTKFGDGGCDFEPIGALYKTWVWQLAEYLELPSEIVEKTPSAGLWPGQTDEKELGASYGVIDSILYRSPGPDSFEELAAELGVDSSIVGDIMSRVRENRHKSTPAGVVELDL